MKQLEALDTFVVSIVEPAVCPLLKLEGLQRWLLGRTTGYAALDRAVDRQGFYVPMARSWPPGTAAEAGGGTLAGGPLSHSTHT